VFNRYIIEFALNPKGLNDAVFSMFSYFKGTFHVGSAGFYGFGANFFNRSIKVEHDANYGAH